eukprot:8139942-Alexandrium_andersonii.AAC.1
MDSQSGSSAEAAASRVRRTLARTLRANNPGRSANSRRYISCAAAPRAPGILLEVPDMPPSSEPASRLSGSPPAPPPKRLASSLLA